MERETERETEGGFGANISWAHKAQVKHQLKKWQMNSEPKEKLLSDSKAATTTY